MKKRSHPSQSTNNTDSLSAASPSTSSSSSSSSSCVVDDDCLNNNNIIIVEENPPNNKPKRTRRKRVSINNNFKKEKCGNANVNRRSSIYRGVTRHRWTGRFEAHLWDKSSWNNVQNKKGRQVYLGAYDSEVDAARTYDLAALKYWGPETTLNFPVENYTKELEEMQNGSKEEYLASLRRSSGFSRGVSKYRGVARHHHNGRWEARIGRVFGNKYLYLGTFSSQEEAAAAYDLAAIEYRGANAVTNFDISNYIGRVKNLMPKAQSSQPNPTTQAKATLPRKKQQLIKQQKEEEEQQDDKLEVKIQPEVEDRQDQQTHVPCHDLEESKLVNPLDQPSMLAGMDGPEDDRENLWSFCWDTGDYDPFLVPDIPFVEDSKSLDLFSETGFEENIDMIFDGEAEKVESFPKAEENSRFFSSSSPSSPSSITSLVSCQV